MRKIVAILLSITLMSVLFIIPIHAHEEEETMTTYSPICLENGCGGRLYTKTENTDTVWDETVDSCTNNPLPHRHGHYYTYTIRECTDCFNYDVLSRIKVTVCSYA